MLVRPVGNKIGIHGNKPSPEAFAHLAAAHGNGAEFPVYKLTQELTALRDAKERFPRTLTMGRIINPMDGMGGIDEISAGDVDRWAEATMRPVFDYYELNPGLASFVDVQEIINEADPPTVTGYHNLGLVMKRCVELGRLRLPGMTWAIGSFNAGTPEFAEMVAFLDSGVIDGAPDDVVLTVHEGVLNPSDPIDEGVGDTIPGTTKVPPGGGSMVGRIAYFADAAGSNMVPAIVSEAYLQAYDDMMEAADRAIWLDEFYADLWYVLSFLPFTHSPTSAWKHQNYTGMYDRLVDYTPTVADRSNAEKPDDGDPARTVPAQVWELSQNRDTINADAALQRKIFDAGYVPYSTEFWREVNGEMHAIQTAFDWKTGERAVAFARVPDWGNVQVITGPGDDSVPGTPPIRFVAWPTDYRVITQVFGARPDYYRQFGLPGHAGVDLRAPYGSRVYTVADGVVERVTTGKNFGNYVVVNYGEGVSVAYAHLLRATVSEGERVPAGRQIAYADNTGNSDGNHLHLTLKWANHTFVDGNGVSWPNNYFDPTPLLMPFSPTFPGDPAPTTVDLLPYLRGDGRAYMVRWPSGNQEKFRTVRIDDRRWLQLKNNQWEEFWIDAQGVWIWRGKDTSAGEGLFYDQREPGYTGARWCKRRMAIGETYSGPGHRVQSYRKSNCESVDHHRNGNTINRVQFLARHQEVGFPTGVTVKDVVELQTLTGEKMFFGKGFGLVGWIAAWGRSSIAEILDPSAADNEPEAGCFGP